MSSVGAVSRFGSVVLLPIDRIDPSSFQTRVEYGNVKELAENIQSNGLLQPILVRPKRDGRYEIIHGHRRFMACRQLGRKLIEGFVAELDDDEAIAIQGSENIQRHDYSPIEESVFYANYRAFLEKKMGRSVSYLELARKLNINENMLRETLCLLDLPPDIQEKVHKGQISRVKAFSLTVLTRQTRSMPAPGQEGFTQSERTDRYYEEIRKLAEEIEKSQSEPLQGLRTHVAVAQAAQLIRDGVPFEEAVKKAQLMEAIERMKREVVKEINPRDIILRVKKSQPSIDEVRRSLSEVNMKLVQKMLDENFLRCPYCGGKDLVWNCSGKPVGGESA